MNISFSISGDPPTRQPVRIAQCSSGLPWTKPITLSHRLSALAHRRLTHLANMTKKYCSACAAKPPTHRQRQQAAQTDDIFCKAFSDLHHRFPTSALCESLAYSHFYYTYLCVPLPCSLIERKTFGSFPSNFTPSGLYIIKLVDPKAEPVYIWQSLQWHIDVKSTLPVVDHEISPQ